MSAFDDRIELFGFTSEAIPARLEGLSREQLLARPGGRGTHIVWLLGHIASARAVILQWLDAPDRVPLRKEEDELFGMGTTVSDEDIYPPTEELLDLIRRRGEALAEVLGAMTEEDADRTWKLQFPFGPKSPRGMVGFMSWHENYHYGQLSWLAAWLGNHLGI